MALHIISNLPLSFGPLISRCTRSRNLSDLSWTWVYAPTRLPSSKVGIPSQVGSLHIPRPPTSKYAYFKAEYDVSFQIDSFKCLFSCLAVFQLTSGTVLQPKLLFERVSCKTADLAHLLLSNHTSDGPRASICACATYNLFALMQLNKTATPLSIEGPHKRLICSYKGATHQYTDACVCR